MRETTARLNQIDETDATVESVPDADPADDAEVGADTATELEPEPEPEVRTAKKPKATTTRPEQRSRLPSVPRSPALREIRSAEDSALKDVIDQLGAQGSFKISVSRLEPEMWQDRATGVRVKVGGHLKTYTTAIDEEMISKNHGGGKFHLRFQKMQETGRFHIFCNRTIDIAGDPRTDDLPRDITAPVSPTPHAISSPLESPKLVEKAFEMMQTQIDRASDQQRHRPEVPRGIDPAIMAVISMLEKQMASANAQVEAMRSELAAVRTAKPAEDPFKERMISKLVDDDSARIQSLRAQYDSEIRIMKEEHRGELSRQRDHFERDKQDLRQSHDRELASLRQSHEIQLQAARGAYDTNIKLAESENRRLERDNGELRVELKELRARKEKGLIDQIKEIETLKEAIGVDDGDKSTIEKAFEALPGAIEIAKGMMSQSQQAAAPAQQAAAVAQQALQSNKIVKDPEGRRYKLDDKGNLRPLRRKSKDELPVKKDAEGLPVIAQEVLDQVIGYLERAFQGNQEPEIFAQSSRTMVPPPILEAIRDHGVDVFLSKVAKLPGTSPLSSQLGKNWTRKVGAALVGE